MKVYHTRARTELLRVRSSSILGPHAQCARNKHYKLWCHHMELGELSEPRFCAFAVDCKASCLSTWEDLSPTHVSKRPSLTFLVISGATPNLLRRGDVLVSSPDPTRARAGHETRVVLFLIRLKTMKYKYCSLAPRDYRYCNLTMCM